MGGKCLPAHARFSIGVVLFLGLWPLTQVVWLCDAKAGFDFADPFPESALDFRHSFAFAQVAGLIKVLEVGTQLQQKLLRKAAAHRRLILHAHRRERKITRFAITADCSSTF